MDVFAFADKYGMRELREDIMTVAIKLDWAWHAKYPERCFATCKVGRMCSKLPSDSKMYQYFAKSYALFVSFDDPKKADALPALFLLEMLRNCAPLQQQDEVKLEAGLQKPWSFHKHASELDRVYCQQRQSQDGSFYNSFLGVCMQRASMLTTRS